MSCQLIKLVANQDKKSQSTLLFTDGWMDGGEREGFENPVFSVVYLEMRGGGSEIHTFPKSIRMKIVISCLSPELNLVH